MSENVLIICSKILKNIWISLYRSTNNLYIKLTWLMAPKSKLRQISNYEEKPNG